MEYSHRINPIQFQFTHPGRGATKSSAEPPLSAACFNSRTPGGVRLHKIDRLVGTASFNSRTPGGVRLNTSSSVRSEGKFQFTHPGRGATARGLSIVHTVDVSIHAPREGCDFTGRKLIDLYLVSIHAPREGCDFFFDDRKITFRGFNSRTPGGVRLPCYHALLLPRGFQFTHPGRGAT